MINQLCYLEVKLFIHDFQMKLLIFFFSEWARKRNMHVLLTKNFLANYQEKDSKWLGVFPTQSNFLALISKSFSLPYTTCVTEVFENAVFSVGVVWTLPNNNKIMYILEILKLRKMRPPFYELEKYDFCLLLCPGKILQSK